MLKTLTARGLIIRYQRSSTMITPSGRLGGGGEDPDVHGDSAFGNSSEVPQQSSVVTRQVG